MCLRGQRRAKVAIDLRSEVWLGTCRHNHSALHFLVLTSAFNNLIFFTFWLISADVKSVGERKFSPSSPPDDSQDGALYNTDKKTDLRSKGRYESIPEKKKKPTQLNAELVQTDM